jgi:hypothetical protein
MNKPLLEENRNGCHLAVYQDMEPESPAAWGNDDVCGWSRHFTVENRRINKNLFGGLMRAEGYDEHFAEAKKLRAEFPVFPIDAYVHGGVVLSLHGEGIRDRWDTSGHVGCVMVSRREEKSRTRADKIARGIIATWNQYLAGEVHGFVISKPAHCDKCGQTSSDEIMATWGLYGDAGEAMAAAREAADEIKQA